MNTFCPQCGFGVKVDEDSCCVHCGAMATGEAVDQLFNILGETKVALAEHYEKSKRTRKMWKKIDGMLNFLTACVLANARKTHGERTASVLKEDNDEKI